MTFAAPAYEELLETSRRVSPIPILVSRGQGYRCSVEDLRREVLGRGVSALLLSNPCQPRGKLVSGRELAGWMEVGRELDCTLLIDEFYAQYVWKLGEGEPGPLVSAARYVEDVDSDPVVIVDGLTKNWRYPGWRITWTVGPRQVIESVERARSFLDDAGSTPSQR